MQFRGGKAQRKDARAHNANARPWVLVLFLVLDGLEVLDIRGPSQPVNERAPPPARQDCQHSRTLRGLQTEQAMETGCN